MADSQGLYPESFNRILQSGRPLSEINPGSDEVALDRAAAIAAVRSLGGTQIVVLGGDVLVEEKGELRYAYAFWHSEPREEESPERWASRSHREAVEYIEAYPSRRGPEPLFVLVCDSASAARSQRSDRSPQN